MQKFKKIMKAQAKNSLVYWTEHEGMHYIGSRHFMIRVQTVSDNLRKVLAECGLFGPNSAVNVGVSAPAVTSAVKIMPEPGTVENWATVEWLLLQFKDAKMEGRLGIRDNEVITANSDYLEAMEELFNQAAWRQGKENEPIVLGNALAIVLPYRINRDMPLYTSIKALQNLKRLEAVK